MQLSCIYTDVKMKKTRNTKAKTKIQELIDSSSVALSPSEIHNSLEGICDKVTIYRILQRLMEADLIHKIVDTDGSIKYASCYSCQSVHEHDHVHFSCENCKSVTCLDDVKPKYELAKSYMVSEMNFIISGICPQCS